MERSGRQDSTGVEAEGNATPSGCDCGRSKAAADCRTADCRTADCRSCTASSNTKRQIFASTNVKSSRCVDNSQREAVWRGVVESCSGRVAPPALAACIAYTARSSKRSPLQHTVRTAPPQHATHNTYTLSPLPAHTAHAHSLTSQALLRSHHVCCRRHVLVTPLPCTACSVPCLHQLPCLVAPCLPRCCLLPPSPQLSPRPSHSSPSQLRPSPPLHTARLSAKSTSSLLSCQ